VHIAPYANAGMDPHEPTRERKLLLHSREIDKLQALAAQKGLTVIPVKLYFKNGRVKLQIALGKGKNVHDRRDDLKARDMARDTRASCRLPQITLLISAVRLYQHHGRDMTALATSLTPAHLHFLDSVFPGDGLVLKPEEMAVYGADSSRRSAMPWAVVRPRTEEQIVELLKWAEAEKMPLVPRLRGTGMSGGAVPAFGGIVVSTLWLNRVIDINATTSAPRSSPA
jgi:hypothetical protein